MKLLAGLIVVFFGISASASSHLFPDEGYTRQEIESLSIVIQQRLERDDPEAAIMMAKRFITEHSSNILLEQTNGHKKHRLIRSLVASRAWRMSDGRTRAEILRLALFNGPVTPLYERELLYLLAETQSLEGMASMLDYAFRLSVEERTYLPNEIYLPVVNDWMHVWRRLSRGVGPARNKLLADTDRVRIDVIGVVIQSWLRRFSSPDELVMLVNARTSIEALQALSLLIVMRKDWPLGLSAMQSNRLNFWRKSRGCEVHLTGKEH